MEEEEQEEEQEEQSAREKKNSFKTGMAREGGERGGRGKWTERGRDEGGRERCRDAAKGRCRGAEGRHPHTSAYIRIDPHRSA